MSRLPPRPRLTWREDAPYSEDVGDIYFAGDGLAEARAVFLAGCGLPDRWAGREHFVIGELGFGSGLNVLAAWDMWRQARPSPTARLIVMSVEGAPMTSTDAARVHARWPELAPLSQALTARWPDRARGMQAIDLEDGVRLLLSIDEAEAALAQWDARIDAWFLDGFAPARNPAMWSPAIFVRLRELSAPGARLATYTVAGDVRRGLAAAGFVVDKRPGHAGKRERLEARTPEEAPNALHHRVSPRRVAVIGAGVAGAWTARAFRDRGCDVTVLDASGAPASGASGNPLALVMPRLDATDTPTARALIAAFLHARRAWPALGQDAVTGLDVDRRPANATEQARFQKLLIDPPLESSLLADASPDGAGTRLALRGCLAIAPPLALTRLLDGATLVQAHASRIDADADAARITCPDGKVIDTDLVVVCAGFTASPPEGVVLPPVEGRLGQIENAPTTQPPAAAADGGYVVTAHEVLLYGATFEPVTDMGAITSDRARDENLAVLKRLRPELAPLAAHAVSRAGVRATTRDRLPFVGRIDLAWGRVFALGGLGARGFLWAPLLADVLAAEAFGEPCPMEQATRRLLDPLRLAPASQADRLSSG